MTSEDEIVKLVPVDITIFVLKRLWKIRELPESEFKGRAEELLYLYAEARVLPFTEGHHE